MGFMGLSYGMPGVLEACAIALAIGLVLAIVLHLYGRSAGWNPGSEIGVGIALTLAIGAGVDAWDLFHLSIVKLESPYVITQTLATIHDPDFLGTRVVFEFAGAVVGVLLGWYVAITFLRRGS
jgi:hypothetical protein